MYAAISSILRLSVLFERKINFIFCYDSSPSIISAVAFNTHGLINSPPIVLDFLR